MKKIKVNKKLRRKVYLNQKGITLIALVVTIAVLLILAGVTISQVFSDDGLWDAGNEFAENANSIIEEKLGEINNVTNELKDVMNPSKQNNLPSTSSTTPYYPDKTFTNVEGTNLSNGLVIKDSNGNEYVWIEVPKTTTVYPTAGLQITAFTEDDYTKIETDLHTYTDYYRNGTSFTDTYYSDDVTGLTSAQYTELKQKMLKSVYQNGGFWIGRYEAGITENGTTSGTPTIAPLSKAGTVEDPVYPYTDVTCSQAQTLASKLSTENYTSSLMFGVQWDLVLKHIEVKEVEQGTELATIQSELNSDSSSWGNYNNATFEINRGKYAKQGALTTWYNYNTASENTVTYENGKSTKLSANSSSQILLTTGASDTCKKMNIYDLAGNVSEWTLEYSSYTIAPCALRGGRCLGNGSAYPSSRRNTDNPTNSFYTVGFRASLYK